LEIVSAGFAEGIGMALPTWQHCLTSVWGQWLGIGNEIIQINAGKLYTSEEFRSDIP
jgi:hypothetical protein